MIQIAIHRDSGLFDLPVDNVPMDEYISTLTYLILKDLADQKWSLTHYGETGKCYIDLYEFGAQVGFIVPNNYITKAWEDYQYLFLEVHNHWMRLDMPDVYSPTRVQIQGCYYVIEIDFAMP